MLSGVSVSCFLFSYLVALGMDASRFVFKLPARSALLIGVLSAGLVAHTIFFVGEATREGTFLGSWFQWIVLGAWGLSLVCLMMTIRRPDRGIGLFLIPVILVLIGLAQAVRRLDPFESSMTNAFWWLAHGISLLLGTMFISLGLAFGLMYLVQSNRLKNRRQIRGVLRLPPLDFLRGMNRLALIATAIALLIGLISGVVLNASREIPIWADGGVIFTFLLSALSIVAATIEMSSRGSLGGRRSAYLSIANFVFLALILILVLMTSHGKKPDQASDSQSQASQLNERNPESLSHIHNAFRRTGVFRDRLILQTEGVRQLVTSRGDDGRLAFGSQLWQSSGCRDSRSSSSLAAYMGAEVVR